MNHSFRTPFRLPRVLACICMLALAASAYPQSFARAVVSFKPGAGAGFGQSYYPQNVLGPPHGNANSATPNFSEQDLLSLGDGGSIVLDFGPGRIVNGPGADITVFENPVQPLNEPTHTFAETAIVSVSSDLVTWTTFPFHFRPPAADGTLLDQSCYEGFAGVKASFSSPENGISPFDPAVSGGDSFDLSQIGVASARYVKIQDTGTTGATQTVDPEGHIVDDPGNHFAFEGAGSVGFDLDAVSAIHSEGATACNREWALYE